MLWQASGSSMRRPLPGKKLPSAMCSDMHSTGACTQLYLALIIDQASIQWKHQRIFAAGQSPSKWSMLRGRLLHVTERVKQQGEACECSSRWCFLGTWERGGLQGTSEMSAGQEGCPSSSHKGL